MPKKRIYELAKELNISSTQLLSILKELGVEAKTHASTIEDEMAKLVQEILAERPLQLESEPISEVHAAQAVVAPAIPASVGDFATLYHLEPAQVAEYLRKKGEMVTVTQPLSQKGKELLKALVPSAGPTPATTSPRMESSDKSAKISPLPSNETKDWVGRAPVVTVLGHVDHGKTTLLDAIRHSSVAEKEKGGITQKIGASEIQFRGQRIVFIDTPGHEAFTAMRAQGAKVTDIAILVVAADEGVMPQTVEALNHAKAAKVSIIVALNKMDKEAANPDRVKQQLSDLGLVPEEWGGETIYVPLSAKKGEGVDKLLEMISLLAEVQELKTSPNAAAFGTVIEARLDRGLGPVAAVIVQGGLLRVGDILQVGETGGKVRSIINAMGERLKQAGPSTAVEIVGLEAVPRPGVRFQTTKDLKLQRSTESQPQGKNFRSTDRLFKAFQKESNKFPLILKADSQGTLDALMVAISKVKSTEMEIETMHAGVGAITESDIDLASVTASMVLGFNVRPDSMARKASEREDIEIRTYDLIYELVTDLEGCIRGRCEPRIEEKTMGRAVIRKLFRVPKLGFIAGSYIQDGKVERNSKARVVRDNIVIGETKVTSLRRFKEDVRDVASGYECGIGLDKATDLREGDLLEFYTLQQV
ncbi:MAG: translation initiation factor IF-2 [Coprothermobacterota bacterium]|nr:translation initiation factor IF-2 [Coprothermobacterota bacterium]